MGQILRPFERKLFRIVFQRFLSIRLSLYNNATKRESYPHSKIIISSLKICWFLISLKFLIRRFYCRQKIIVHIRCPILYFWFWNNILWSTTIFIWHTIEFRYRYREDLREDYLPALFDPFNSFFLFLFCLYE